MCESNVAEAGENNAEFSFAAAVRGYHVYRRVWLPHVGQRLEAGRELGNAEDRFAIAVYSLGEHSDHTARADDNPIVKRDAQMSEGLSSLQRTTATAGSLVSPFPFYLHLNKPSAEFIYFLFNTEWPY